MDSNMSFHMDADVKAQMTALCAQLGMTFPPDGERTGRCRPDPHGV